MIKVSVIITAFGKPIFLEKAIKSIFNQTLDGIELIIVDDNNPDTEGRFLTEQIVTNNKHSSIQTTYIKHKHNKNGSAARNTGFSIAQGKYISFLDSDDEYCKERLKKCYNKMEQCSDKIAGVYTGCEYRKNGKIYNVNKNIQSGNFIIKTLACTFKFGTGSNIFIRKSIVNVLDGFDETFLRHQDNEFLVRVFEKYAMEAIPEVLVIKNNDNLNLPGVEKMIDIKSQFLHKYKSIIQGLHYDNQKYIYHSQYIAIAEHALKTKKISISNDYYLQAKKQASLTVRNKFRRIIFIMLNYIK